MYIITVINNSINYNKYIKKYLMFNYNNNNKYNLIIYEYIILK